MNLRVLALDAALTAFLGLTGYVVYQYGYQGFYDLMFANSATTLAFVDLVITLSLISIWMWFDARERGAAFWPFAVITLFFGSAGPLGYLMLREWGREPARERSARTVVSGAAGG